MAAPDGHEISPRQARDLYDAPGSYLTEFEAHEFRCNSTCSTFLSQSLSGGSHKSDAAESAVC